VAKKSMVHEIVLQPMDEKTGVVSHTTYKTKRSGQGGGPDYDHESTSHAHPSMDHLIGHIKEHLGPHFGAHPNGPENTLDHDEEPSKTDEA